MLEITFNHNIIPEHVFIDLNNKTITQKLAYIGLKPKSSHTIKVLSTT